MPARPFEANSLFGRIICLSNGLRRKRYEQTIPIKMVWLIAMWHTPSMGEHRAPVTSLEQLTIGPI